jgi:hypothetical protein
MSHRLQVQAVQEPAELLSAGNVAAFALWSSVWLCLQVIVEPHRHEGIFIARGKEDALVTKNMVPGESVYGEKRVSVEVRLHKSSSRMHAECVLKSCHP